MTDLANKKTEDEEDMELLHLLFTDEELDALRLMSEEDKYLQWLLSND